MGAQQVEYEAEVVGRPARGALSHDLKVTDQRAVAFARELGVAEQALRDDSSAELVSATLDHILWGGPPTLTAAEVAEAAGVDVAGVRQLWKVLGFPDPEDRTVFFPADVEVVRVQTEARLFFDAAAVTHMTRAVGSLTRGILEAAVSLMPESYGDLQDLPLVEQLEITSAASGLLRRLIDALPAVLVHQAREAAAFAATATFTTAGQRPLAIGFCDLVDSTLMTNRSPALMGEAVSDFEDRAAALVVEGGGRVVKFLGDEVMYATPDREQAIEIALGLLRWVAADHRFVGARAGVAEGLVLTRDGDVYGSSVSLAARLVAMAPPGSLLVADDAGGEVRVVRGFADPIRVRLIRA